MNEIATIAPRETSVSAVGMASGNGAKIAPQNLAEVIRFAEVMSRSGSAIPKHLRENPGACMRITLQALEWEMSPFALGDKSYIVNDRIAYEAQLIAAVVNTRSGIKGRLKYRFDGDGGNMTCTVTGTLDGGEHAYTSPPIGSITTKNSPLWKSDPQQQLGYFSARSWARRYTPEVILGVYDREEAATFQGPDNAKDVTPGLQARLAASKPDAGEIVEGFQPNTETVAPPSATDNGTAAKTEDMGSGADNSNSEAAPSSPASSVSAKATSSRPADQAAPVKASQQAGAALTISQKVAIAKGLLWPAQAAVSANDPSGEEVINDAANALQSEHGDGAKPFLVAVFNRAIAVVRGEQEIEEVRELIAAQIGCEPEELMEQP